MKWTIGYCLKFRLESLNYSQEGAALLLSNLRKARNLKDGDDYVTVAHSTISRMEKDPMNFKFRDVADYATVLGTDLLSILLICYIDDIFDPNELMDLMKNDKAVTKRILLNLAFREEINLLKEQFLKFAGRCDFNY